MANTAQLQREARFNSAIDRVTDLLNHLEHLEVEQLDTLHSLAYDIMASVEDEWTNRDV